MSSNQPPLLGILGAGQLGRMMALAAIPMGIRVRFLSPGPAGPMEGLGENFIGDWNDPNVLSNFVDGCDAVTVESEWAPAELAAEVVPAGVGVWPSPDTLLAIRHKGRQKDALREAGLPLPDYARCATKEDAVAAIKRFGLPVVVKKYEGSYDGYGNATIKMLDQVDDVWDKLAANDGLLIEAWAPFVRELSVIVARSADGDIDAYPVAYTEQRDHRCHAVVVPAGVSAEVEERARAVAMKAVETVEGVGVTGVELFEMEDGSILVNELAPRPHNTGHYTIEACHTSQFENHVRAVLGLPLGDCSMRVPAACMINVLGTRDGETSYATLSEALSVPGAAGVELFEMEDGSILVNELAPRPHNTGHYTIEACHTSQFENHVRAVLGLPLGDCSMRVPAACMINVLGTRDGETSYATLSEALSVPGAAVHIYGKEEVRKSRKMGHVTTTGIDRVEVRDRAEEAAAAVRL